MAFIRVVNKLNKLPLPDNMPPFTGSWSLSSSQSGYGNINPNSTTQKQFNCWTEGWGGGMQANGYSPAYDVLGASTVYVNAYWRTTGSTNAASLDSYIRILGYDGSSWVELAKRGTGGWVHSESWSGLGLSANCKGYKQIQIHAYLYPYNGTSGQGGMNILVDGITFS